MTKFRLPICLNLDGLRILFVGAGVGTATKLSALRGSGIAVRIVAPIIHDVVKDLLHDFDDAELLTRPFQEADLEGVALVYGMTDDVSCNQRVAELSRQRGLWFNVAHQRGGGSFTSPALWNDDTLQVAFHSLDSQPGTAVAARDAYQHFRGAL